MKFKKEIILVFFLLITNKIAVAQCGEYTNILVANLNITLQEAIDKYSDSTQFDSFSIRDYCYTYLGKKLNLKEVIFKSKTYKCVENYQDVLCSIKFKDQQLFNIEITIFYSLKDSLEVISNYEKLVKNKSINKDFKFIEKHISSSILEFSSGNSIQLKDFVETPQTYFFKEKTKKEYISIRYTYSNMNEEFKLEIEYKKN